MDKGSKIRERMLNHPTYWSEGVNGFLYDAIFSYMKKHKMKRKDLANHLDISPSRVSQILNDGNINFSIDKIIQIALKVDKFPVFEFEDKETYLEKLKNDSENEYLLINYNLNQLTDLIEDYKKPREAKIISINKHSENSLELGLSNYNG